MAHQMNYSICGASFSNMAALKSAGFLDFHLVVHGGGVDPNSVGGAAFVNQCRALKVSPILNNGNDGIDGWNGSASYYPMIAAQGYTAAGGESEWGPEDRSIMNSLVFMNYGGEGLSPLSNIYSSRLPEGASGHGICNYLETYTSDTVLHPDEIVQSCVQAWRHQNKAFMEVGIMIGGWIAGDAGHSPAADTQVYINLIRAIESATDKPCSGVCLWWGHGTNGNNTYVANGNNTIIQALQKIWPPDPRTLAERITGVAPPGPTPTPTPTPTGTQFDELTDFDVYQYLTKAHNGEPTPGTHKVVITPKGTADSIGAVVSAQVREFQPGNE